MRDIRREVRLLVGRYGGARARPLTLRQQQRLAREAQAGNQQAGAKLVESCLGLVVAIATEHTIGEPVDEIVQRGALELLERLYGRPDKRDPDREVTRYDPDRLVGGRGVKFWTFARPYVLAAMRERERVDTVPLPEDEYNMSDPLRQDSPPDELLREEREEEIERAYARALEAVRALPDPDRPMFLLRHGIEGEEVKRLHALELVGVSGREGKTALQRAGRTLARDPRIRALKRLIGYETAQDLRELRERSAALYALVGPAPPPRPPVREPRPAFPPYIAGIPGKPTGTIAVWTKRERVSYNPEYRSRVVERRAPALGLPRVIAEGPYNPYRKHPGTFGGEVSPPEGEYIDPRILTQPPTFSTRWPVANPGPYPVFKKPERKEHGTWVRVGYRDTPHARGVRDVFVPAHTKIREPASGVLPIPATWGPLSAREGANLLLAMHRAVEAATRRKKVVSEPNANP